jgi:cytochrome c556
MAVMLTSTAFADPIADRQALMKANGKAAGSLAPIVKGEKPFDAATVKAAFETLAEDARNFDADRLFPAGSETGSDTKASPAIWSDRAGFVAAIEKFRTNTAAAVAANVQDLDALKLQFGAVSQTCSCCHQAFRVR